MLNFLTSLNPHDLLAAAALVASVVTFIVHKIGHVNHRVLLDELADELATLNNVVNGGSAPDEMVKNPPA